MGKSSFYLDKWFLDFVSDNGEAMIFYSAKLSWIGFTVGYTSWINYHPESGTKVNSHFGNSQLPIRKEKLIYWGDSKYEIDGQWIEKAAPIESKIYNSDNGYLEWKCYQPVSEVNLSINGKELKGTGYAERLILTAYPWLIPMKELRWGRSHTANNTLVWIELREEKHLQWVWLNGEKLHNCIIEDHIISSKEKDFILNLDRSVILESENKILNVVTRLINFLPGFKKLIPISFLMAKSYKWLSKCDFKERNKLIQKGYAIHEWVDFRTSKNK